VLPTGVKIRFVFTADDVIHAWWVPSLGWKQDAIPGIINRLDRNQQAGHLPRPVRGTVRTRPRLHADRGQGRAQGRIRTVAGRAGARTGTCTGARGAAPAAACPATATTTLRPAPKADSETDFPEVDTTTTTTSRKASAALAVHHQPQGHRHPVPGVSLRDVLRRRRDGAVIRAELFQPGLQFVDPEFFNQMTTMHALVMIFGA
jgi:hypothetical protein